MGRVDDASVIEFRPEDVQRDRRAAYVPQLLPMGAGRVRHVDARVDQREGMSAAPSSTVNAVSTP